MVLNDSCVGYWKFDEDTGTSATNEVDSSTITVPNDWVTGKLNSGIKIDSGETSGQVGLGTYSKWTYNSWIKFTDLSKETRFFNRADGNAYLRISTS